MLPPASTGTAERMRRQEQGSLYHKDQQPAPSSFVASTGLSERDIGRRFLMQLPKRGSVPEKSSVSLVSALCDSAERGERQRLIWVSDLQVL